MTNNTSTIKINVTVDENKVPDDIRWTAADGGIEDQEAKAMLLSIWDSKVQETLRIDLWAYFAEKLELHKK